jgi:hypothetical protein
MGTKHKSVVAAIAVLSLATAAPAFAEDSSLDGYGGPGANVLSEIQQPSGKAKAAETPKAAPAAAREAPSGALPFTGLDLGLLGVAGVGLLGLGVGMRRLTRSSESS